MISSMTGYGKAELIFQGDKIVIEIRSVNGKSADINLKGNFIPRSKEPDVRQLLASRLQRGSIDLFISVEGGLAVERPINRERFMAYYQEIYSIQKDLPQPCNQEGLLGAILRIPEVFERKNQEPDEEQWEIFLQGILSAIEQITLFRDQEGLRLAKDIFQRVELIESYIHKVEELEPTRMEGVKERLLNKLNDLSGIQPDQNRFEQELIYYLEKLDITEEKVRLRQHCSFFKQTAEKEAYPGRKLSFIAQEMGREINTMGSKANHAAMQQWVVMMKDELEKIKEQLLNVV